MTSTVKNHLLKNDKVLHDIIKKLNFPTIHSTKNVFHDLMSCIIEQQIHYRSTKKIFQKSMEAAGLTILTVENFPILEKEGFKNLKLSTNKYETILRVVDFFKEHKIDWFDKTDDEILKILSSIKGVGKWSIQMILLFTLGRENIFPVDDYHLKKLMTKLYPINENSRVNAQLKEISENWSPYKSYGTKYLLEWKEASKKGLI